MPSPKPLLTRRQLAAFVAAPFAAECVLGEAYAAAVGEVTEVRGTAFAEFADGARPLSQGAAVSINEIIRTGEASRLKMLLAGQTRISLGALATIKIDRYLSELGGDITVESGALLFDKSTRLKQGEIKVSSPYALIAVRGTRFFAGPSNGVFGIFVASGSVSVVASRQRIVLNAGQGTNIAMIGAPPTPPTIWGAARIEAALASVS